MKAYELRNLHFDRLVAKPGLRWLGQNTNHCAPHPEVIEAMVKCARDEGFHIYAPPMGLEALRAGIIDDLGLDGQTAMVTDGAVSALYHVCHSLLRPGDELITTDPTWNWPMAFARSVGAVVKQIPIYGGEHGYRLDPRRLREAITEKTRLVYIVDPNNPLGSVQSASEIADIVDAVRAADAYLIHDCTYRHFAHEHHLAAKLAPERTITIYSFSKWLGLAGLRVGAVVTCPDLMERLSASPPNNLGSSMLAQKAALAGLRVKNEWFPGVLAETRSNLALVKETVDRHGGMSVPVFPSNGNFLVIECSELGISPEALVGAFAEHDIMIRQGAYHTPVFGGRFVKVSLSVPREWAQEFVDLLPRVVEEARGRKPDQKLF